MKKFCKFIFMLIPVWICLAGCVTSPFGFILGFDDILLSANFPRRAEYQLPPRAKVAVIPFQDTFNDGTVVGGVADWMVDNFFAMLQGDISNFFGGERGSIVHRTTKRVSQEIEEDPNLVLINKKNADQADYLISGGITGFDTSIDREKKDNRKYCTKEVFVSIRYQLVDVKTKEIVYTEERYIDRQDTREGSEPHAIAVVSDDIDMLAKQIVDITRPHEVKVTERIYLAETKNKDFKTACKLAKKVETRAQAQELFARVYAEEGLYQAGYNSAILLYLNRDFEKAFEEMKIIEEKFHTKYAERALENIQKEMEYQQKSQMMESSQELLEVSEN